MIYFFLKDYSTYLCSEVTQCCPILCNLMDCSLPGFSVHGIYQSRLLEWVDNSISSRSSRPRDRTQVSLIVGRWFTLWATREALKYFFEPLFFWPGGNNTGVGCHSLLQEIFPIQELNSVSHLVGRLFTVWATREVIYAEVIYPVVRTLCFHHWGHGFKILQAMC